jgi:hypothetical protein
LGKSIAVTSARPSASAIAGATNAGFRMEANGTNTTRVGPLAAMARASSTARPGLSSATWSGECDEARGRICEPAPQRLHVRVTAEQGCEDDRQRGVAQFVNSRGLHGAPRASKQRVADRAGQIKRRRQRAHGLDLGPPPFSALQSAHRMHRQAGNRREFFLGVARSFAKCFQLGAK